MLRARIPLSIAILSSTVNLWAQEPAPQFTVRDQAFANYKVRYITTTVIPPDHNEPGFDASSAPLDSDGMIRNRWEHEATYDAKRGWIHTQTMVLPDGKSHSISESSLKDAPTIMGDRVHFGGSPDRAGSNTGIVVGLHPALALGFSDLQQPKSIATPDGGRQIKGRDKLGRIVEIWISSGSGLPTRMLASKGGFALDTRYDDWQKVGQLAYPRRSSSTVTMAGGLEYRTSYEIQYLSLGSAKIESNANWFKPGFTFYDERLGKPAVYTYEELLKLNRGSRDLTAAQLLEFTRLKLAGKTVGPIDRMVLETEAAAVKRKDGSPVPLLLVSSGVLGILALGGYGWANWRRKAHP